MAGPATNPGLTFEKITGLGVSFFQMCFSTMFGFDPKKGEIMFGFDPKGLNFLFGNDTIVLCLKGIF